MEINIGDKVAWKWGNGIAEGVVTDIVPTKAQIVSKGKVITRNGSSENPAIIMKHQNGNEVIKLQSELFNF